MTQPLSTTWQIEAGSNFALAIIDPASLPAAPTDKEAAKAACVELRNELIELQEKLYAESKQSLLVVLQAMDAGGKDGTIKSVFAGVNPQGVRVESFGVPSENELAHDFLWRIHAKVPVKGQITIFNRSHYEDVLVVRVKKFVDETIWRARYQQIRNFEELMTASNTHVIKIMLHISKDEQRKRLQERIDDVAKRWKWNPGDLNDRELWDDYMSAFEEAITQTTTKESPWFVVPANRNWYRDWAVLTIIVERLRQIKPEFPNPPEIPAGTKVL